VGQFLRDLLQLGALHQQPAPGAEGFATNLSLMVVAEVFVLVWGLVGFGMPIAGVPWLSDWSLFQLAVLA
jgi:hypothetical protein